MRVWRSAVVATGCMVLAVGGPASADWSPLQPLDRAVVDKDQVAAATGGGIDTVLWRDRDASPGPYKLVAHQAIDGVWQSPVVISDHAMWFGLAMDDNGNTLIASCEILPPALAPGSMEIHSRARAGRWRLAATVPMIENCSGPPSLAIDDSGNAVLAWRIYPSMRVQASYRPAGGEWTAPVFVSAAGDSPQWPVVGIDEGDATVAWSSRAGGPTDHARTSVRARRFIDGAWTGITTIMRGRWRVLDDGYAEQGDKWVDFARIAEDGKTVVWSGFKQYTDTVSEFFVASSRWSGSEWGRSVVGHRGGVGIDVASNDSGQTIVAFSNRIGANGFQIPQVLSARLRADGTWRRIAVTTEEVDVDGEGDFVQYDWPRIELDDDGVASAMWVRQAEALTKTEYSVRVARQQAGRPWGEATILRATAQLVLGGDTALAAAGRDTVIAFSAGRRLFGTTWQ